MPFDAMNAQSEEELLAAYARGDAQAARALTQRLVPLVFGHACRMLGGDRAEAEDVAQEAMLRLWRAAPDWRADGGRVRTWLYRVTANLCIDRLRKARPADLDAVPDPPDPTPGAEAGLQQAARAAALQCALNGLPPRQRQAVVLRHIDGLGNDEIAAIMDIGPRAVESLTARGKRALAEALTGRKAELGFEDDENAG